jgi:phosphopantetheinyl transferase
LSAPELVLLESLPAGAREQWLLRCWCAKEAAGKAAGTGLSHGPERPRVVAIEPERELVAVELGGARIAVHTAREENLIVATTLGEAAAGTEGALSPIVLEGSYTR